MGREYETAALRLTFQVNAGAGEVPGIKEALAMVLERWGDVRLVEVREVRAASAEQMKLPTAFPAGARSGGYRR